MSRYLPGIDFAPRDLQLAIVEASEGRIGTLSDRILLYCYQYDPASGRYGLLVIILLGGHWARHQGNYRRGPAVPPDRRPLSADPTGAIPAAADRSLDDGAPTAADTIRPTDTWRDEKKSP